jgi:Na+/H+ antiporter NhaD/arsenite permease-like protein
MELAILITFIAGYTAIATENFIRVNKAATALITGVLCWTLYMIGSHSDVHVAGKLAEKLGDIAGILFFLLGAMTIVELMDAHDCFDIITERIQTLNKKKLLWIISIITFFLSAILDNLTTTIVMISLSSKLIKSRADRLFFAGMIVIASNAGGAWSPIGDVSTTMLWIGEQITSLNIIKALFLPSLTCLLVPLLIISYQLKGEVERPAPSATSAPKVATRLQRNTIFFAGLTGLIFVPLFKTLTHLPPFMGMMLALGIIWAITELINKLQTDDKDFLSVVYALRKIDSPSILFFLGILLSVSALEATGMLAQMAGDLNKAIPNQSVVLILTGLLSAIVDNVPLVAASQGMYSLEQFPTDHPFWEFLTYCTGTGGSILIIGSAAGVAAMGIEKIDFFWYTKKIMLWALIGYFSGAVVFLLLKGYIHS